MAGTTQATAPAAADAPKGAGSSTAGARHAADNRPPMPDRESMMMEALSADLGEESGEGTKGERTKKEGKTGSPGEKAESRKLKAEKPKAGSKKLDLGDDEDEEGDGTGSAGSNE